MLDKEQVFKYFWKSKWSYIVSFMLLKELLFFVTVKFWTFNIL